MTEAQTASENVEHMAYTSDTGESGSPALRKLHSLRAFGKKSTDTMKKDLKIIDIDL